MVRLNDLILVLVLFASMLTGILKPELGRPLRPFPLFMMMALLFLSLLPIRVNEIWKTLRTSLKEVAYLTFLKLILLPLAVYYLFRVFFPDYALSALLLAGISTGVVAPFISGMVSANGTKVLIMVVVTSPLVVFTLPLLVKLLCEREMTISLGAMTRTLALVIFVPIIAVESLRRTTPRLIAGIMKRQYPISLAVIAAINLAVFSQYAQFFRQKPSVILVAGMVAVIIGCICMATGILSLPRASVEDRIAAAVSMGNINNVLIIVFASRFFSPVEPTVAAMYMIPFFGLILPLRMYRRWSSPRRGSDLHISHRT
jgi:BASS family bile acid:Na+ symporter